LNRVAVTIIYNGLHHLKHKGYVDFMLENFDYWAVVEGHSRNGGSTWFCKNIKTPTNSTDGTVEYMKELAAKNPKVLFYSKPNYFPSKDAQVNQAVVMLKKKLNFAFLWQIDCDEHWKIEDIEKAEDILIKSGKRQATFQFNHFVGEGLVAKGRWGDEPMPRLFLWRGQKFIRHEPPAMHPLSKQMFIEGVKFDHYSYYFAQDVKFKEQYYGESEGLYSRWEKLPDLEYPQPITVLYPKGTYIGDSDSKIIRI